MKLLAIIVIENDQIVKSHYDLSDVSFWTRSNVKEIINESVIKISQEHKDIIVDISNYKCHLCNNTAVITDDEYPANVAINLCKIVNKSSDLQKLYIEYQDPSCVDKVMKIQKEIDDIKDIMHVNIEKMIMRGESLDKLLIQSENLSFTSKVFLKDTQKLNSCCVLL